MSISRSFALIASMLAGAASLAGCASEEAKTEDVESLRSAICNTGGGGGGDACSDPSGFCPAHRARHLRGHPLLHRQRERNQHLRLRLRPGPHLARGRHVLSVSA